jgi:predicted nucleotidyltransferase
MMPTDAVYPHNHEDNDLALASSDLAPIQDLLRDFKRQAERVYATRLHHILLSDVVLSAGSWARGEATEHSDIDLLIALEGPVDPGQEIDRMIDIVTDLSLEYDTLISVYPVSVANYATVQSPLLLNVRREGVVI